MISVLVAGEAVLYRELVTLALDREPDITVVGQAGGREELREAVRRHRPEVVVLDGVGAGREAAGSAAWPGRALGDCRVVVVADGERAAALRRLNGSGPSGVVSRSASLVELLAAVRRAACGSAAAGQHAHLDSPRSGLALLTPREAEVLQIASKGHPAPHIAEQLGLSVGTVRNYLTAVITKLNARNLVDAVRIAWESDWR